VVCFSEIILDVIIFGRDAKLDKLVLERTRLLEETMYFSVDYHLFFLVVFKSAPAVMALRVEARRFTRLYRL
jgi:hypothetical protein